MLNSYPSGHCLFYPTLFDKSNSAPRHLNNVWGHSILLIKISQRHSLKHLQKVIVNGGIKAVSMEKKSRLQSKKNSTIKTIQLNVDVFIFQKICRNIFLTSWSKLSCLLFSSMKQQIFHKRFSWFSVGGWPIRKQKSLVSCDVLNVGVSSTAQPSSPNWMISLKNMDLIVWSIRQLPPMEEQPCKALLMELFENSKMLPLTVFQPVFLEIYRSQTEVFWNYWKT